MDQIAGCRIANLIERPVLGELTAHQDLRWIGKSGSVGFHERVARDIKRKDRREYVDGGRQLEKIERG